MSDSKRDDVTINLIQADRCLEQIGVKGNAAFLLVNARRYLKHAYDELNKQEVEGRKDDSKNDES